MKIQITNGMFMALIINMVYAKAIGLTQGIVAREAGGDMWIASIFATLEGLIIMYLTVSVIRRIPGQGMIEHSGVMLGKWASKLVAILLIVFFAGAFGTAMITFVYHLMDYFLPDVPVIVFIAAAVLVGGFGCFHGLEVMGRMALIGIFSIIWLNILLLLGSFTDFDILNLMPVLDSGLWNTLKASRHNDTDWAMATMMAAMILPMVKESKQWSRSAAAGIWMGGIFVLMWPILEGAVLSPSVTGQYIVACMQMARSASIGLFIHRYEMFMVAFFATSALVQIMVSIYCASSAASKLFGLKDYRSTLLPVSLILGAVGYWVVSDHNRAMRLLADYWPPLALSIAVALPAALWLLGFLFKSKLKSRRQTGT